MPTDAEIEAAPQPIHPEVREAWHNLCEVWMRHSPELPKGRAYEALRLMSDVIDPPIELDDDGCLIFTPDMIAELERLRAQAANPDADV